MAPQASRIRRLDAASLDAAFFERRAFAPPTESVARILNEVHSRGDAALFDYGEQFDHLRPASLEISAASLAAAEADLRARDSALYDALVYSRDLALHFAREQKSTFTDFESELAPGLFAGQKNVPVTRAGVYVPAGRFPLLSTVIMTLCPAIAAGVRELVLCTPPRQSTTPPQAAGYALPSTALSCADGGILAAAALCMRAAAGSSTLRVFATGGAQAIAAMAYSTESVPRCDVIVGPGNKYVAEAKRQVAGVVGIDFVAGPSEVLIIADGSANPAWVAADLLAQAEHDPDAESVLITDSPILADAVERELAVQLAALTTHETARASLERNGAIISVSSIRDALSIANRKAPEHLELALDAGETRDFFVANLRNYGSLFIGHRSAEVLGDYSAGVNHTLPTAAAARYTGGLGVRFFLKTLTTVRAESGVGVTASLKAAELLGQAEGLAAHQRAATIRLGTAE